MDATSGEHVILSESDFNCFTDEVEFQKTEQTTLTFFYFGVLVSTDQSEIENKMKEILSCLGPIKLHSHKTYKKPLFKDICEKITALIIENNLQVICFPFAKEWLDNPILATLKVFELPDLQRVRNSNYRSQAWLLFIHVFNTFMMNNYRAKKVRIVFASDWLKKNEMVVHEGTKLMALTEMISTGQKAVPLLALADHVGYLFQRFKKVSYIENGVIKLHPYNKKDHVANSAIYLFKYLTIKGMFHTLDIWEWIRNENKN